MTCVPKSPHGKGLSSNDYVLVLDSCSWKGGLPRFPTTTVTGRRRVQPCSPNGPPYALPVVHLIVFGAWKKLGSRILIVVSFWRRAASPMWHQGCPHWVATGLSTPCKLFGPHLSPVSIMVVSRRWNYLECRYRNVHFDRTSGGLSCGP